MASATRRGVSRRTFLKASGIAGGGLVVWLSSACLPTAPGAQQAAPQAAPPAAAPAAPQQAAAPAAPPKPRSIPKNVDAWLQVGQDGSVTLRTGKVEFGQGIETGFKQLVADELDVPFDKVNVVMGSTDSTPFDQPTVGSNSTRSTGPLVRQAGAEMRQWLLELGSAKLGVPADQLETVDGVVRVKGDSSKSATYADLAAGKSSAREMTGKAPLKQPDQFKWIGQSIPRVDVPLKVDGAMKYGYDTVVPGMVHGKVVRPPSYGAKLTSVDYSEAQKMPGVVGIYRDGDFVGLAAERLEQATAALAGVKATWEEIKSPVTSDTIFDFLKSTPDKGKPIKPQGDASQGLSSAAKRIRTVTRAPYVSHAQIEPESVTANATGDTVEVWASTQAPFRFQEAIAQALNKPLDSVVVHTVMSGGAFGRKSIPDAAVEAARLSAGIKRPVRINWTREEEFQWDQFRPAMLVEIDAGLAPDGSIAGWKHDLYAAAYHAPAGPDPMGTSADESSDIRDVYDVSNTGGTFYQSQTPLPVAHWRANGAPVNVLARETTVDELAQAAGQDPVRFREKMLANNPRMLAVLKKVVEKAGWRPGVGSTGQGVGMALDFANGTYIAEVARVSVDRATGKVHVDHVDAAVDCGLLVNPAAATAQLEGAIVSQGVGSTLKEQVLFANGKVANNNFAAYNPPMMNDVPTVDIVFVEDKTQPMAGLGEPAVIPFSAAVSNAIYDAIGVRLRDLPFTPNRVTAAVKAKTA